MLPRDARAAAFSYDGRDSAGDLRSLVTLALSDSPRFHTVSPPGPADELSYLEMVAPNDVARMIETRLAAGQSPGNETIAFTYGLFGHEFEKGVVFRARLRAAGFARKLRLGAVSEMYQQFVDEPPPLGP